LSVVSIKKRQATWNQRAADLVEDIEFLAHPDKGGERNPMRLLQRLGYTNPLSLARRLHRRGYHRVAGVFERDDFFAHQPWELLRDRIGPDLSSEDHG
jgi:hypothetical protein